MLPSRHAQQACLVKIMPLRTTMPRHQAEGACIAVHASNNAYQSCIPRSIPTAQRSHTRGAIRCGGRWREGRGRPILTSPLACCRSLTLERVALPELELALCAGPIRQFCHWQRAARLQCLHESSQQLLTQHAGQVVQQSLNHGLVMYWMMSQHALS